VIARWQAGPALTLAALCGVGVRQAKKIVRDQLTQPTQETLRGARVISFHRRLDRKYYFCLDVLRASSRDYIFRTYQARNPRWHGMGQSGAAASATWRGPPLFASLAWVWRAHVLMRCGF
jgi:hypothetical protein